MDWKNIQTDKNCSPRLPKYLQLADAIVAYLKDAKCRVGERLPGERDLADIIGMSPVTVGRAFNELVRKGILERRIGSGTYFAGKEALPGALRIGIVTHEPLVEDFAYVSRVLRSFHHFWRVYKADVISLLRRPGEYEAAIRDYNLAGIMVLAPHAGFAADLAEMARRNVPLVTLGITMPELPLRSFGTDHRLTGIRAVEYLAGLGHRRIAILASCGAAEDSVEERIAGYCEGMWRCMLPANPGWVIRCETADRFVPDDFRRIFAGSDAPTAVMLAAHRDIMPFYWVAGELGLNIPADVSVLGFDDHLYCNRLSPPLTVFSQCEDALARLAAAQLENIIRHRALAPDVIQEAVLIERESCRKI